MATFQTVGYLANDGETYKMRLKEESVAAAGGDGGAPTSKMFVKISKGEREFGLRPRYAVLSEEHETTDGRTFKTYRRLPMTTPTAWNALAENSTVTIGGTSYEVVGKEDEDY